MSQDRPLSGIVIIELGHSVAAPYAGMVLADLGARVIKVENPDKGDYARGWGPPFWKDTSSSFASLNRGKEGITIDFSDPDDAAALRQLIIEEADCVIQNLRPGLLRKFGLDAETLCKLKPSLVWADIGAFGASGPLASKPGYDPLVQASTGIMSVTGEGGRPPVRVGVSIVDIGSGMWAVIGLLSSLITKLKTGAGTHVGASLYETGLAWMTVPLAGYEAAGDIRKPYGSGVAEIVPYQAFQTADGWMMIAAGNDSLFRKLCGVLGLESLAHDPLYATNAGRVVNREALLAVIAKHVALLEPDDLGKRLDALGVPNSPLLAVDAVARHPQTEALDMSVEVDGLNVMGVPLTFDGARPRTMIAAPKLGQHNTAIKTNRSDA